MDNNLRNLYGVVLILLATQWFLVGLAALAALVFFNIDFNQYFPDLPLTGRVVISSYFFMAVVTLWLGFYLNIHLFRVIYFALKTNKVQIVLLLVACVGFMVMFINEIRNAFFVKPSHPSWLTFASLGEFILQVLIFGIFLRKRLKLR